MAGKQENNSGNSENDKTGANGKKRAAGAVIAAAAVILAIIAVIIAVAVLMDGYRMGGRTMSRVDQNFHDDLFGRNTYIFSPEDDPAEISRVLEELWRRQETNQFGEDRYAVYFMPGEYAESIEVKVGFYMQAAGLGELPSDTKIQALNCDARWLGNDPSNHNACCNFWRGAENLTVRSNVMWAVSQATFMRRMQIDGALYLHDNYGWCSGGFLADSNIELLTDSGTQQQWLSRNCNWQQWMGANWNLVFSGIEEGKAPKGTWPGVPYTDAGATERIQEKPFLIYDEKEGYMVYVPEIRSDASGTSWKDGSEGERIPISRFYVTQPDKDTAETMNKALKEGKHLFLTPGIYELKEPLAVERKDTIVLGAGLATLRPENGNACIVTADEEGIILAGILFDAAEKESANLLIVGESSGSGQTAPDGSGREGKETPISLSDLFFRVGGMKTAEAAKAKCCITIESDDVIGDNFWVWRADHGDHVAWDENTAANGIIVNGDRVKIYALMVEHFQEYQTVWNGNDGKVVMYQSEIPYDVPSQKEWQSHGGSRNGYASFYVDDDVERFEGEGLGIYLYNRDAEVELFTAMEAPDREDVRIRNICTVMLTGYPGMQHVVNDCGGAVLHAGEREVICEYKEGSGK